MGGCQRGEIYSLDCDGNADRTPVRVSNHYRVKCILLYSWRKCNDRLMLIFIPHRLLHFCPRYHDTYSISILSSPPVSYQLLNTHTSTLLLRAYPLRDTGVSVLNSDSIHLFGSIQLSLISRADQGRFWRETKQNRERRGRLMEIPRQTWLSLLFPFFVPPVSPDSFPERDGTYLTNSKYQISLPGIHRLLHAPIWRMALHHKHTYICTLLLPVGILTPPRPDRT